MVNHIRTLLLNENGSNNPGYLFPLEEYVDKAFTASKVPFVCQKVLDILFGKNPDRAYKNWRLYQLSRLAEATDLLQYWFKFDKRVTHFDEPAYEDSSEYGKITISKSSTGSIIKVTSTNEGFIPDVVLATSNQTSDLSDIGIVLTGKLSADDINGRCLSSWKVNLTGGSTLETTNLTNKSTGSVYSLSYTNALSQPVLLNGTNVSVSFRPTTSEAWAFDFVAKPSEDIGIVLANLDTLPDSEVSELFSGDYEEYKTFLNYWNKSTDLADRLTAIALCVAYRLQEARIKK